MIVKNKTVPDPVVNALKLVLINARGDTGGSRRCAQFILSLWNGDIYKCDLQELLYIDNKIFASFLIVLNYLFQNNDQISSFVNEKDMKIVINQWGKIFKYGHSI